MRSASPNTIIKAIYETGPAPSLISAHVGVPIDRVKKIIVEDEAARAVYLSRIEDVYHAIEIFGTDKTKIARHLHTDRSTLSTWIAENTRTRRAYDNARGAFFDLALQNQFQALSKGERWATEIELLRSDEGRRAGYGDRPTHDLDAESVSLGADWQQIVDRLADRLTDTVLLKKQGVIGDEDGESGLIDANEFSITVVDSGAE